MCELAFQTLFEDKIVFSHEDLDMRFHNLTLDSGVFCFGLLQSAESVLVDGHGVSFHFLHLTFQEYLAALYLVRQPTDQQLQLCQSRAGSKRFEMVWRFFFGLSFSVCNKSVGVDVSKLLVDAYADCEYVNRRIRILSLCHFALEANQRAVHDLIASEISRPASTIYSNVCFEARIAFDSAAIIHVIANLQVCHCSIILRDCGLRDEQTTALADALASERRDLWVDHIDLSGNRLTDESLADLFERASSAFSQSLRSVYLRSNMIGPKAVNSLMSVLEKSFSLIMQRSNPFNSLEDYTHLDISDNPLGVDGCKALRDALCANKLAYLKDVSLAGSLTSDADTNAELILALGSGHECSLESLDLSRNNLGAPGGKALGKILSDLHLHTLILTETMLGDEGVAAFSQNLEDTVSCIVKRLHLDNNGIQAAGISCLAKSVCTGRLLLLRYGKFTLADNPLGLEGVTDVVKILTSNHFQAGIIDLSGCQLTTAGGSATNHDFNAVGVQQLICSQQVRATFSNLIILDDNNFSGEGVHILAAFMYTCQGNVYNVELFCRSCGITSNDLKQFFVLLSELKLTLPRLESWDLSNNDIDDDGVSALIQQWPMFPELWSNGVTLDGNIRISSGMVKTLGEELEARKIHVH
jgi:Ran GTPase-activating protein (RanGAP) involved in mRNA processing and transport